MTGNRFVRTAEPRYVTFLFYLFLVATAVLIVWRTAVVNWHVWFAPLAWLADVFGLATSALFLITVHRRAVPVPCPVAVPERTADILIPTVNEPLPVLEPTVLGATRVRGVRRVLVLDDGDRPEVARMARLRGAGYVARTGRDGAKAGNLNHGLGFTDAELVATFDADHIPLPDFLEHTVGYFDDPDVAVVQTPQAFYNTESFTFRPGWHEQQMFYQCVQPAKNAHNGAFYTGTGAVLRRDALDGIGGFATGTATEDIHTSLRLHSVGWRSVFLPRRLAYGLEVDNLREYYRTRRRWAAGSLGLLLRSPDSPLRIRGLSMAQRLSYLSSTLAHLQGAQRLAYLLVPLLALLTARSPVSVTFAWFGVVFFGFAALSLWLTHRYSYGAFRPWYNEVFNLALAVPQLSGLAGVVRPERKFQVSLKNAGSASGPRIKLAYGILLAAAVAGLGRAGQLIVTGHGDALVFWSGALLALQAALLTHLLVWVLGYERRAAASGGRPLGAPGRYRSVLLRFGSGPVPAPRAATGLNPVHGWVARPYWAAAAQQDAAAERSGSLPPRDALG